jgi:MFS family permease
VKIINRTVWILSLVSLFADVASEMLYPVTPIYLREIGFTFLLIGVLEGLAECTAGLSKGYFGKKSDEKGTRLPFVKWGYFLSAVSKPMVAVFIYPLWIFFARTTDRLGKGIRTAARDALLSQNATNETKARVFSFHRAMDTLGAVTGPVLALIYLHFYPQDYISLFYLAFIPGLVSVLLIFLLKEKKQPPSISSRKGFFSFIHYWKKAPKTYKMLVSGLLVLTLFNSSDVFLLLRTQEITGDASDSIRAYIFYNLVYAVAAYPMGALADRAGMRKVFTAGLLVFSLVYAMFSIADSETMLLTGFFLYGIYAAATEGIAKAWITNITGGKETGTAIGFYTSFQSIGTFLASAGTGLIWTLYSGNTALAVTAIAGFIVFLYFLWFMGR